MMFWMTWIGMSVAAPPTCGTWVRTPVAEIQGVMRDPVVSVDEQRRVHLMWYAPEKGVSKYALGGAGRWSVETLGPGRSDMVVDSGIPYLMRNACDQGVCTLNYTWKEKGEWSTREAFSVTTPMTTPALAMGPNGLPHVTYVATVGRSSMVMHASPIEDDWHAERIQTGTTRFGAPDIVVADDGAVHILYTHADGGGQTVWARKEDKVWTRTVTSMSRAQEVAVHWGAIGALYAAYFKDGQRIAIQTPSHGWVDYGQPLSGDGTAAIGREGAPNFVLVQDVRPLKRLEWARWTGTTWESVLVAADPYGFRAVSFTLDSKGCPHIVYQHSQSPKTVYARAEL